MSGRGQPRAGEVPELRADCRRCVGLCCVALPFTASADFAIDKDAGVACPNLTEGFGCGIHSRLRSSGFAGCAAFDCMGAGQKVSQVTFGGRDWREDAGTARDMFAVFGVVRVLHELMWYLTEAVAMPAARPVRAELRAALARTGELGGGSPAELLRLDVAAYRGEVNALLVRAGELARAAVAGGGRNLRGADLVGADLRGSDLRGANLRGALMVAADLRGARLGGADLTGADLRGADVRGVDLRAALFVTRAQVNAVRGDQATRLPGRLERPGHW